MPSTEEVGASSPLRRWGWASLIAACGLVLAPALASAQERRPARRGVAEAAASPPRRGAVPGRSARLRRSGLQRTARRAAAPAEELEPEPAGTSPSRSIGSPDRGRLRRGVELTVSAHLLVRPGRGSAFGTAELVGAVERAAARVAEEHAGARLVVGDLSAEAGGRLAPHRSHRSGRDVDLGFYLLDAEGRPARAPRFVSLSRSGCGTLDQRTLCFDAERNWALVTALLADPVARVQYLLVAPDLRDRLLAEGARRGAPAEQLEQVRTATASVRGSASHRSHFHARIYCPVDDRPDCVDEPPYHAWYEGVPSPRRSQVARRRAEERRRIEARARAQRARRR